MLFEKQSIRLHPRRLQSKHYMELRQKRWTGYDVLRSYRNCMATDERGMGWTRDRALLRRPYLLGVRTYTL